MRHSIFVLRLTKKNGLREEESSWYWDPVPQTSNVDEDAEKQYKTQIQRLQDELAAVRDRDVVDLRPDTDEELNRLRDENKNLTANLEDLDNQHQMAMDRLLTLKKELQKNFEVLKQEHEELRSANDEYANEVKVLLAKIGERDNEIERINSIKSDFDTLLHKYQNLERIHSLLRENAEKFQEENQELHEEVFKLQEQVTKLEHDVEIATKHSELSDTVPKKKYEEVLKELHDLKGGRNSNEVYLDEINIDDNAKTVIEALKRDINELRHKLSQRESDINDNNDNKIVKSERIMQLYNKYVNFDLPVDYVGEIPSSTDNVALYKLECAFKTLNSFKKEVDTLEHKLSEKTLNVNHLQTQIDDITTENDYLTSDVQHFERELSEMKKNNDFLISEIAALKNTSKLEPIIETHEDNLAKLETELADSNNKNKTFESKIKRIEAELSEVNKEKRILQEGMSDMKKKYKSILEELETYRAESRIVEQLELQTTMIQSEKIRKEIDDLKKRLSSVSSKNEQLCIDVHILENDKVLLTNQVDELKNTLEVKSSAYKELESMNDSLEDKIVDLKNKLEETGKSKQEIEADKFVLEKKLKDLEDEVLSKTDFEKVVTEKSQISDKLDQTQKQNSELLQTVDQLSKEVDAFKLKEQEWINSNKSIMRYSDDKVAQLEINNSELQKIKAENESLTSTNLKLEKHVSEKNELSNKFEQTLQQNRELSQQIEQLNKEIETFKLKEQEWIGGNKTEKLAQFDIINSEFQKIKTENERLKERNLHVEAELSSTDGKISNLEDKFEKLLTDLEEKDSIIDKLNATISENTPNIATYNQNADVGNDVEVKTQVPDYLGHSLTGYTEVSRTVTESSKGQEELCRLREEKDQLSRHVKSLEDEVTFKSTEISRLTYRLDELEKYCVEFKGAIDIKNKEIQELNKLLLEATNKAKALENITDVSNATKEKSALETTDLRNTLEAKEAEILETKSELEQLEKACMEYKTTLENATVEKNDLIKLITLKHNESIQYHNEIQRLNQVILEQTSEFKRIMEDKEKELSHSNNCLNCGKLTTALEEKDEIIMAMNQNISDYERLKVDLHNNSETVRILTTKCEDLDRRLTMEVETVKKLTAENAQLSEQEQNSSRELERLRHHLVELEESYTQELMTSEQKLSECQVRLHQVEERAKQTSTVYTSNSIRANQEVETLRNQIKLLEKQREEVQTRLSDADDARSRSEAALTNLQVVLEQFQLDKERDIHNATEKIRNKMEEIKRENDGLRSELAKLNSKLEESIAGLQAATRLGDQVETKTAQINDLKEQVRTLQTSVAAAEERYYNAISNQQDKVDKNLVKNLVINYVTTAGQSNINRVQVLRVLSTVLDFNQKECERLGLARAATAADSLAAEFVKFLQNESKPRAQLPDMNTLQAGGRASVASSRKSSTVGPPVFDLGHRRNPSTGSNNLLFQNLEAVDTASQKSTESDTRVVPVGLGMDTGVNQTRNNEGAILKHVLKDM